MQHMQKHSAKVCYNQTFIFDHGRVWGISYIFIHALLGLCILTFWFNFDIPMFSK